MILLDVQQTLYAAIMIECQRNPHVDIRVEMVKHLVLNSIRSYKSKYSRKYGELIVATDTGSSWRKSAFPYYKANRKLDREASALDWEKLHAAMHEVKDDLEAHFPYRIIRVERAEADDVIGTLVHEFGSELPGAEPILILSGDKDFKQLHTYMNVEQYDPVRSKKVIEASPSNYLLEHVIKGDSGDGVPNILSPDNCLVIKQRQGTVTAKRLESYKNSIKTGVWENSSLERNYHRNREVIDLKHTPTDIREKILESYHSQAGKTGDVFNYLIKNRMKHLMEYVNDF